MGLVACAGDVDVQSSTGGPGGGTPAECAGATPILATDGTDSGFHSCPDGTIHRATAKACNPDTGVVACMGTETMLSCKSDADCTAKKHGRCASHMEPSFGGNVTACDCFYPCTDDSECDSGSVCVCAGVVPADLPFSYCASGNCKTGNECSTGECGISSYADGCNIQVTLACRDPGDMCRTDAQCNAAQGQHCVLSQLASTPGWQCAGTTCASAGAH
jgi:hypothetical protein